MIKKKKNIIGILLLSILSACSTNDGKDLSFLGQPVEVNVNMGSIGMTRVNTNIPVNHSVYFKTTVSGSQWIRYTSDGTTLTSANPLLWISESMTIDGYYINGNADDVFIGTTGVVTYTVSSTNNSFLAARQTITYTDATNNTVNMTPKQQLAKITVTVGIDDGSTLSNPMLGGGRIYMSGTFANAGGYDANGYATGGVNATGWTTVTQENPTTIEMNKVSETKTGNVVTSVTYEAVIIPQRIDNTSVNFFTIRATNGAVSHTLYYKLAAPQTFVAGRQYNLIVDDVTNTLYLEQIIEIEDFIDSPAADYIDNAKVTIVTT